MSGEKGQKGQHANPIVQRLYKFGSRMGGVLRCPSMNFRARFAATASSLDLWGALNALNPQILWKKEQARPPASARDMARPEAPMPNHLKWVNAIYEFRNLTLGRGPYLGGDFGEH
jgi:hypothetical protein